jgi:SAM-dependent methyltransferase
MDGYEAATYGDAIADVYDDYHDGFDTTDALVELLAELAGRGPALELGIGTGRVALPLAEHGVEVHGIDASEEMVRQLRAKPGGAELPVTIGDFGKSGPAGPFSLVYVPFNTFFALDTQAAQRSCAAWVAASLAPGGRFVVEAFVPDVARFDRGQRVEAHGIQVDRATLDLSEHDPVTQTVRSQHVVVSLTGIRMIPVHIRYAYPAELDLIAALAGLELEHRWGGFRKEPFTAASAMHVSVYRTGP